MHWHAAASTWYRTPFRIIASSDRAGHGPHEECASCLCECEASTCQSPHRLPMRSSVMSWRPVPTRASGTSHLSRQTNIADQVHLGTRRHRLYRFLALSPSTCATGEDSTATYFRLQRLYQSFETLRLTNKTMSFILNPFRTLCRSTLCWTSTSRSLTMISSLVYTCDSFPVHKVLQHQQQD
jgi:hypothetical protein